VRAIVELAVACDLDEYGATDYCDEDLLSKWTAPRFVPERDAWLLPGPGGRLAGYADLWEREPGRDFTASLLVHPRSWGEGAGERLLAAVERRARERIREAESPGARLASIVPSVNRAKLALFRGAGYRHTRTYYRMDIDLAGRDPRPEPPAGIEIRGYRPGPDDGAVQAAIEESFSDHFRHVDAPAAEWMALRTKDPRFDPELWFLAWEGPEVAGAVLGYDLGEISWIRELGVRPPWRRRGVGLALLERCFEALKARGRTSVCLGVDSDNAHGATALYERAGMVVGQKHEFWERALALRSGSNV
jgi:mycothiol synthase